MSVQGAPNEFQNQISNQQLYAEIEERVLKLAKRHPDIIGTAVLIGKNKNQPHQSSAYRVSVIVYMRPENLIVNEIHENITVALTCGLENAERLLQKHDIKQHKEWETAHETSVIETSRS